MLKLNNQQFKNFSIKNQALSCKESFLCVENIEKTNFLLTLSEAKLTEEEVKEKLFKTLFLSYLMNLHDYNIVNIDLIFQASIKDENFLNHLYQFFENNYFSSFDKQVNFDFIQTILHKYQKTGDLENIYRLNLTTKQLNDRKPTDFEDILILLGFDGVVDFGKITLLINNYCKLFDLGRTNNLWLNNSYFFVTKTMLNFYQQMVEAKENKKGYFDLIENSIDFQKQQAEQIYSSVNLNQNLNLFTSTENGIRFHTNKYSTDIFNNVITVKLLTTQQLDGFYQEHFLARKDFIGKDEQEFLFSLFNSFLIEKVSKNDLIKGNYFNIHFFNNCNSLLKIIPKLSDSYKNKDILLEDSNYFISSNYIDLHPLNFNGGDLCTFEETKPSNSDRENFILKHFFELLRRETFTNSHNKVYLTSLFIWFYYKNKAFRDCIKNNECNNLIKNENFILHLIQKLSFKEFIRSYSLLLGSYKLKELEDFDFTSNVIFLLNKNLLLKNILDTEYLINEQINKNNSNKKVLLFNSLSTIKHFLENFKYFSVKRNGVNINNEDFQLLNKEDLINLNIETIFHFLIQQFNKKIDVDSYVYYLTHEINRRDYFGKNNYFEKLLFDTSESRFVNEQGEINNVLDDILLKIKNLNIVEDKRHINFSKSEDKQILLEKYYFSFVKQELLKDFYFWNLVLKSFLVELNKINFSIPKLEELSYFLQSISNELNVTENLKNSIAEKQEIRKAFLNYKNINYKFVELFSSINNANFKCDLSFEELPFYSKEILSNLSYLLKNLKEIDRLRWTNGVFSTDTQKNIAYIKQLFQQSKIYEMADLETLYCVKLFLLRDYKNHQLNMFRKNKGNSYISLLRNSLYVEVLSIIFNNVSYEIKERIIDLYDNIKTKIFFIPKSIREDRFKFFEYKYPFYKEIYNTNNAEQGLPINFVLTDHIFDNVNLKQKSYKDFYSTNNFDVLLTSKTHVYDDIALAFILDLKRLLGIQTITDFNKLGEVGAYDFDNPEEVFIEATKDVFIFIDKKSYVYEKVCEKLSSFERFNQNILKQNLMIVEDKKSKLKELEKTLKQKLATSQNKPEGDNLFSNDINELLIDINFLSKDIQLTIIDLKQKYEAPYNKLIFGDKTENINKWYKIFKDLKKFQ